MCALYLYKFWKNENILTMKQARMILQACEIDHLLLYTDAPEVANVACLTTEKF